VPGNRHAGFGRRFGETHPWQHRQGAPDRPHQRVGRPHVATWAETATVLAADLMSGCDDPRPHAAELLGRALAGLPAPARAGRIRLRADAGYFAGQLARAALFADVQFAIGAKRIAPLWRILDGVAEDAWADAIDMTAAQVAVADYCPDWWPTATRLLIRRVRLDVDAGQVSVDPRARRRRTLHPDQRVLPLAELADLDAVYAYSFVVTNLDVSTSDKAAAVEHWYRHRTQVETSSGMPSSGPGCVISPRDIPRSTPPGCGGRCSRPASPAGCTSSPPTPYPMARCSGTASAAARR
jgi:hypothetical protein